MANARMSLRYWIAACLVWLAAPRAALPQGVLGDALENMLRPSAAGSPVMNDAAVRPVQFVAEQPNEPLGFSGARFNPGPAVDPGLNSGVLVDDPIEDLYDPDDPDGPAPTASSGEWIRSGCWYTRQIAVYMTRSTSAKNVARLATDLSSAVLIPDLAHLEIAPSQGFQPGLRSTLGHFLGRDPRNRDHAVEFTFLGLTHWENGASLTAKLPGSIVSDLDPTRFVPAYNGSNFQSYYQTSTFNSYELNYRISRRLSRDQLIWSRDNQWVRQATRAALPSIFAGLRVISIAETLKYDATSNTANGSYNIATHNNLVGLQAGGEWFFERYEWRAGIRGSGGALVNWDNQSSRVRILDSNGAPLVPNRNEFSKAHPLAFVGELGFIVAYQFTPNFAFRSSYDLMWVTDLALAQNQITFAPSTPVQISTQHSLLFQGVTIGFEWVR